MSKPVQPQHEVHVRLLEQLQSQTETTLESLVDSCRTVELDQTVQGRLSRIDAMTQQQMAQASQRRLKAKLGRILAALERARAGRYAICTRCNETIDNERLRIDPAAPLCRDCLEELQP